MYDSVPLNSHDTTYSFFTESDSRDSTVTGMTEETAIKWLISNPHFRNAFISDFFDNPSAIKEFYGLQRPFTDPNKVPGDIDLLLVDPFQPQYSIAFECKRVKAISTDTGSKVNNVQAIKKCVRQANAYRELGFYQTYLTIILLDDGRAMTTPNTMFRYGNSPAIECIYNIPWQEPLHEDVGIIYIKVNQTTGKSIELSGSVGFCIDKTANYLEQTTKMTSQIRSLFI